MPRKSKGTNVGAIFVRPPQKAEARRHFLRLRDLATNELDRNKAAGLEPSNFATLFMEMAEIRYAAELETAARDQQRKAEEKPRTTAKRLFG